MKVIAEFVDHRNGKRYSVGDGNKIDPALEPEQIKRLTKAGCLAQGNEKQPESPGGNQPGALKPIEDDGLEAMTVEDLKALAELHKVNLADAKLKAEIVAALRAAQVKAIG